MWDKQLKEWLVAVDLKWPRKKVKGFPTYGNNKGWVLVGELMPGHHNEEISDADDAEIRDPFIINEATFVDITAAASEICVLVFVYA